MGIAAIIIYPQTVKSDSNENKAFISNYSINPS